MASTEVEPWPQPCVGKLSTCMWQVQCSAPQRWAILGYKGPHTCTQITEPCLCSYSIGFSYFSASFKRPCSRSVARGGLHAHSLSYLGFALDCDGGLCSVTSKCVHNRMPTAAGIYPNSRRGWWVASRSLFWRAALATCSSSASRQRSAIGTLALAAAAARASFLSLVL